MAVVPDVDLTDPRELAQIVFRDCEEAVCLLKRWAYQAGFALAQGTSRRGQYVRLHCTRGSKKKVREDDIATCKCFYRVKYTKEAQCMISKFETAHRHELTVSLFAHYLITPDQKGLINELYESGVEPAKIQQIMERRGCKMTTTQICAICKPKALRMFGGECSELIEWTKEHEGVCLTLTDVIDDEEKIVAVLTILPTECAALQEFCEVIQIDGTHPNLTLRWEVIPITMLDGGRHLVCGGMCFAAYFTTEVVLWLLESIWNVPGVAEKWKVLLTDEDSAFIPAVDSLRGIDGFPDDFRHRLCAMHKKKNFMNKVHSCGIAKPRRAVMNSLFDIVAYSDNKNTVTNAVREIRDMQVERVNKYLDDHVLPVLEKFSRAYAGQHFCCGVTTTSAAESMNRMLKKGLGNKQYSLLHARRHFTNRLDNHFLEMTNRRARRNRCERVYEEIGIEMEPQLNRLMINELDRASECAVQQVDQTHYEVQWAKRPKAVYHVAYDDQLEMLECECQLVEYGGLPCSHIIAVHRFAGKTLNVRYVHERWILDPAVVDASVVQDDTGDEEEEEEEDLEVTDDDLIEIEDEHLVDEGDNSLPAALGYDIDESIERLGDMSQENAYLTLLHFAKSICSLAAQDPEWVRKTMLSFREMRKAMFRESNEVPGRNELQPVIGRPKGRPRKSQIARRVAAGLSMRRKRCQICKGAHNLKECPHLPELEDIRNENLRLEADNRQRRCRVCLGFGHNAATCPHCHHSRDDDTYSQ
jgi:hypothetical protein